MAERAKGRNVNTKDIKKHRTDVLKLVATMAFDDPVPVENDVLETINRFIAGMHDLMDHTPQSLADALDSSIDDINAYLDVLGNAFVPLSR